MYITHFSHLTINFNIEFLVTPEDNAVDISSLKRVGTKLHTYVSVSKYTSLHLTYDSKNEKKWT